LCFYASGAWYKDDITAHKKRKNRGIIGFVRTFIRKNSLQFDKRVYYTNFGIRVSGLWLKIDASRRQNDPRKRAKPREHGAV
jgi:hypothetical protein